MTVKKISALTAMTAMANPDEFLVVDKSDLTMAPSGTTKRLPLSTMLADPLFLNALDTRNGPPWTNATLINNAHVPPNAADGGVYQRPRYRKFGDIVYIEGSVGTFGNVTLPFFVLPVGYRPAKRLHFAQVTCEPDSTESPIPFNLSWLKVYADGSCFIDYGVGYNEYVSVNASFSVLP